jgi:DNA-binding NtrC family response regulator
MERLRLQMQRIAPHFRCMTVRGERGTGKQLVARLLHAERHPHQPFLVLGPETVEARLNYENSIRQSAGTLFLDRADSFSLPSQARLLQSLGWDSNPGTTRNPPHGTEFRVIASTSEDLQVLAAAGRFRQELCERLSAVELTIPPLRDRPEDIPELAEYFLNQSRHLHGGEVCRIAADCMTWLWGYVWPANVRQLHEVIRDGVLRADGESLELQHLVLPPPSKAARDLSSGADGSMRLQDVVTRHILRVLKDCGGNKLRAAGMLGISRSTLYRILEETSSSGTPH